VRVARSTSLSPIFFREPWLTPSLCSMARTSPSRLRTASARSLQTDMCPSRIGVGTVVRYRGELKCPGPPCSARLPAELPPSVRFVDHWRGVAETAASLQHRSFDPVMRAALVAATILLCRLAPLPALAASLDGRIDPAADAVERDVIAWRHDIHEH